MRHRVCLALVLGILGGILLAFSYVNPYSGEMLLSELVLQLSGSRGEFVLGFSMPQLVSFMMHMLPNYIFEVYFGTVLYCHFCTASVYVFSRHPNRLRWYFVEVFWLGVMVFMYKIILLVTVILTTVLRYEVAFNKAGIVLLVYHLLIHAVWLYTVTILINLIAIWLGSSHSFLIVIGFQMVCITLLGCVGKAPNQFLLNVNPISHLILGWHNSSFAMTNQILNPPFKGLDLNYSLLLYIAFCMITLSFGALIIKRHDLLISDTETGAV